MVKKWNKKTLFQIHSNTSETQNLEPMLNPAHYLVVSLIPLNLEYEAQANDGDKSKYLELYSSKSFRS